MSRHSSGSFEELFAANDGQDPESFRSETALRVELSAEAEKYIDLPPEDWPKFTFNWDLKSESQCLALDGVKPADFNRQYLIGFRLGWVVFAEFDATLCRFSRRDGNEELWNRGFKSSLACVIAHLARGLPITPPFVKTNSDHEICLCGGHHRYAVAKATQRVEFLPIYFEPSEYDDINDIVVVRSNAP